MFVHQLKTITRKENTKHDYYFFSLEISYYFSGIKKHIIPT